MKKIIILTACLGLAGCETYEPKVFSPEVEMLRLQMRAASGASDPIFIPFQSYQPPPAPRMPVSCFGSANGRQAWCF